MASSKAASPVMDMSPAAPRTNIAVFVGSWLSFSETFIFDQLRQQRMTRAWVIAGRRTRHAGQFPYAAITHLGSLERMGYRYLGVGPSIDAALDHSAARLIVAHYGLNGAFALPFARRRGLPLVVVFHGHDIGGLLPINRWTPRYCRYQHLAREMFEYASLLSCTSQDLRNRLEELGAPTAKLKVQHLGIDLDRCVPPEPAERARPPSVLMVGRMVEKKGMSDGLRAFREVRERFGDAQLRLVGDGPLRRSLAREARDLGIAQSVHFLGSLPHLGVLDEMRHAHVLLTPSVTATRGDRESGVIVLKEAAAMGLPAVATYHGGIPEVVEHETTGLLAPEGAVLELAEALARLLANPELRERMGRAGRQKALSEFDGRRQAAAFEQSLLQIL